MQVEQKPRAPWIKDGLRYAILRDAGESRADVEATGYTFAPYMALDAAKDAQIAIIASSCQEEYNSDFVTSDGIPFRAHLEAIIDVQGLVESMAPLAVFQGYKCADGIFRDITREQFQEALTGGMMRKIGAFAKRKVLTDMIHAATDEAAVAAITWESI